MQEELRALREAHAQQELRIKRLSEHLQELTKSEFPAPAQSKPAQPPPLPAPRSPAVPRDLRVDKPTSLGASGLRPKATSAVPLERFISQNLLPLIGVAVLLLGVGIGLRWAIDNDYIGPVARVTMGYVTGAVMLSFAERLRRAYGTLSAALIGGGMAVLYFVTYAASGYFELLPRGAAFAMMAAFTVFTVLAALRYDRQLIAHLGLVGAYAVPFLLSEGSGDWRLMLAYVTLLNVGILAVSYRRRWRPLVHVTLALTYAVFGALLAAEAYGGRDDGLTHAGALAFATASATVILGALVARKFRVEEALTLGDAVALLCNGLLYFAVGYLVLADADGGERALGAFALANAAVYVALGVAMRRRAGPAADGRVVPLLAVLALSFVAVAVPAELDGPTVTALWAGLAVGLYYAAGRIALPSLRWGGYALLALATVSLADDVYVRPLDVAFVANAYFAAILAVAAAAAAVAYFALHGVRAPQPDAGADIRPIANRHRLGGYVAAALAVVLAFVAGHEELAVYWDVDRVFPYVPVGTDAYETGFGSNLARPYRLYGFARDLWTAVYALVYALALFGVEAVWRRGRPPATVTYVVVAVLVAGVGTFLSAGLYAHSEIRDAFLAAVPEAPGYGFGARTAWRYVGIAWVVLAKVALFCRLRDAALPRGLRAALELGLHVAALWLLSSELIHQLRLSGSEVPYRLKLSILWGAYAIFLISLGLLWRRGRLRIASMVLFAVTLAKLFAYDLADLSTISKTVVLVVLGVLILLSSYLYTRYRGRIDE